MSYSILDIIPRIVARLNDRPQVIYTNFVLLPFLQDAADELQGMLELYGILVLEKQVASIHVVASLSQITLTPPVDLLEPQRLEERLWGSSDQFVNMIPRMWPPDVLPTDSLRYWDWREQAIHFVGCTSDREVKINYIKRALNITAITDTIDVNNSQLYMITRTAALAARQIGENPARADELDKEATANMNWLLGIGVKNKQRTRTRRKPFQLAGHRRWT